MYEDFVSLSDTNVTAYFYLLKYLMPALIKRKKGIIINLTGTSQRIPSVFKTAYETSKFAMDGYVESISEKLLKAKQQKSADDAHDGNKISTHFRIAFITMSVGSLDMKSQRILSGLDLMDDGNNNLQQRLLKEDAAEDGKLEEEEEEDSGKQQQQQQTEQPQETKAQLNGLTFQRWANKAIPIITELERVHSQKKKRKNNKMGKYSSSPYAKVERVVDLNTLLNKPM
mmetsp:Transcript_22631/g.36315  ORF Transcript_22631/g.36315 Transcript_22631/m.36315 type:complete len:228 (-) Transcript_22631:183-866(-)